MEQKIILNFLHIFLFKYSPIKSILFFDSFRCKTIKIKLTAMEALKEEENCFKKSELILLHILPTV